MPSPRPRIARRPAPGLRPEEVQEEVAKIESMYPVPRPGPRPRPRPATPTAPEREEAEEVEVVRPGMRRTTPPPSPRPMPRRPSPTPAPRMRTPEPSPRGPTYCPAPGFKPEEEKKRKAREYEPGEPEVPRVVPGTPRPLPIAAPERAPAAIEAPAPRERAISGAAPIEITPIPERYKPSRLSEISQARPRRNAVVTPRNLKPAAQAEINRIELERKYKAEKVEKAGKASDEVELIQAEPGVAQMRPALPAPSKREVARTIPAPKPVTLPSPIPSVHEEEEPGAPTGTLRARKKLRVVIPGEEEPGEERKRVAAESPGSPETPGTSRSLAISTPSSRGSTIAPTMPLQSAMRKPGAAPSGKNVNFDAALAELEASQKKKIG